MYILQTDGCIGTACLYNVGILILSLINLLSINNFFGVRLIIIRFLRLRETVFILFLGNR